MNEPSLQERYAPENRCFGCGPANEQGLRIRSFARGDEVVCEWRAEKHHEAFEGTVNGGIVGTLFDCHGNWTAAYHLMRANKLEELPSTVTAEFHVQLRRPTPSTEPLTIRARVVDSDESRAVVEETMEAGGKVTATCRASYVRVLPGHPAYHRW